MTYERIACGGPSWRKPSVELVDEERTLVVCRCGVDMMFVWPRGRADVRCFGCGAVFPRPPHLPPDATLMSLDLERGRADRTRLERLAPALVVVCCALGATLLALGVRSLWGG